MVCLIQRTKELLFQVVHFSNDQACSSLVGSAGSMPIPSASDVSMLLPVPTHREFDRNGLYSWAYHRYESIGRRQHGLHGEVLKALCRAKAGQILNMYGHMCTES